MKKFFALLLLLVPVMAYANEKVSGARLLSYQTLAIGAQSGCDRPAKMVVRDETEWNRVWLKHTQRDEMKISAPPVDFTQKSVVILLGGNQTGGTLEVQHIEENAGNTTIFYTAARGVSRDTTQPFHFALIDAPRGEVVFNDGNEECGVCVKIG
ncbi:MAG TPA: hypothetical protein VF681_11840 [Abditibacteriaceae bacterium]|jgi:hypothetical protein